MKRKLKGLAAATLLMLLSLYIINFILSDTARDVHGAGTAEWFSVGEWPDVYWGLMDSAGNEIVPPVFVSVRNFSEGFAAVAVRASFLEEDEAGASYEYVEEEYYAYDGYAPYEGYLYEEPVDDSPLVWGFVDIFGRMAVPFMFEEAMYFNDNRAAVKLDGLWGFVTNGGHMVVPAQFDWVGGFREGLSAVHVNNRYGFIDRRGNMAIPAEFEIVRDFVDGFALVGSFSGRWGIINALGEVVVPIEYSYDDIWTILGLMARPIMELAASVEQLPWQEVRRILPLHTPIRITDVRTGIYYYVQSLGNGNHADVETSTAWDTERLFEAFDGIRTWTGRPVWVTVGDRVFSAAIHSVPHDIAMVSGNNMDGHVCLHFYRSTTHNTNQAVHHSAILEAQRVYELHRAAHGANLQFATRSPAGPVSMFYASPTTATLLVDGQFERFQAYMLAGNYLVRLRDLAYAFNGTPLQFSIDWDTDGPINAINLNQGEEYLPFGGEMGISYSTAPLPVRPTMAFVYLDDVRVPMLVFNLDGNNVVILSDVARHLGFSVSGNDGVFVIEMD